MSEMGTTLDVDVTDTGLLLRGEIDAHTAPTLAAALDERTSGETVELDLTDVSFMDSSGLRVVIAATERLRVDGGDLVLVKPTDIVKRLLTISGLDDHLTVVTRT